jgi:hypothetical protein
MKTIEVKVPGNKAEWSRSARRASSHERKPTTRRYRKEFNRFKRLMVARYQPSPVAAQVKRRQADVARSKAVETHRQEFLHKT